MLVVSREVRETYSNFLSREGITTKEQYACQKWLRFYLDFCAKYQHEALSPNSLNAFLVKLTEKKQSEPQRHQAP
ncbi:MAG: hypothetical protein GY799_20090 [Desulfobulbaceae bacterium]|nr:hypothetical protein [Desulfobulbaceae bacterium]